MKMTVFSDVALMMEAVSISETSVNFYETTRRNIPEDSHLHTCSRENLKSHDIFLDPILNYYTTEAMKNFKLGAM
jgi:hypothetical protein